MAESSSLSTPSKSWSAYVHDNYIPIVLEAQELSKVEDPENEPFKSKYLAIEKLSNLRHQGVAYSRAEGLLSPEEKAECNDMLAMLDLRRGTLALDTEDPSLADKLLTSASLQLKILEERNVEALQDAYNLLGVIWSNCDEQKKAESYLLEAQRLYHKYRAPTQAAAPVSSPARPDIETHQGPPAEAATGSAQVGSGGADGICKQTSDAGPSAEEQSSRSEPGLEPSQGRTEEATNSEPTNSERHTTSTGNPALGVPPSSDRDLEPASETSSPNSETGAEKEREDGSREKSEFLYTMTAFYLAQVYGHSRQQDQMAEFLGITLDRQLRMGHNFEPLEWAQNCAQVSGYFVQQGDYETAAHCLASASLVLERAGITLQTENGGDVLANVLIGWGRLHMQIIGNSRSLFASAADENAPSAASGPGPAPAVLQDRSNLQPPANGKASAGKAPTDGQQVSKPGRRELRFESLDLPSTDALTGCDESGGVRSYEDAVKQFNKAMAAFKGALEYYRLDGHVTDHCSILFDISTLHKYLAFLEPNESRVCQLHKRRATRLEPLVSALNPSAFPGVWRQLTYELACINQEIVDVRLSHSRPFAKYGAAAKDAVKFYTLFLQSFRDAKGKVPEKVPEGEEEEYLLAQVQLAMLYYKLYDKQNEERRIEDLVTSLETYTAFLKYVEKHAVKGMDERVQVCREMAELLPTKINAERASTG